MQSTENGQKVYRSISRLSELWAVTTNTFQFWMSTLALSIVITSIFWKYISQVWAMVGVIVPQEAPLSLLLFLGIIGTGLVILALVALGSLLFLVIKSFFKTKQAPGTYEMVVDAIRNEATRQKQNVTKVTFDVLGIKVTIEKNGNLDE